jgi:hypothetical protein
MQSSTWPCPAAVLKKMKMKNAMTTALDDRDRVPFSMSQFTVNGQHLFPFSFRFGDDSITVNKTLRQQTTSFPTYSVPSKTIIIIKNVQHSTC